MSFLNAFLTQTATYWAPGAPDGYGGYTFASPAQLRVRWENRSVAATDQNGKQFLSRSIIYLENDVVLDGYLFLGASSTVDPRGVAGAVTIKDFRKVPSLDGSEFERRALL
jgi:hypothetical protein